MPYRKGMLRPHAGELSIFHRMLDASIILVALWASAQSYGVALGVHYALAGVLAVVGFLFFAEWQGLYGSWRAEPIRREAWAITSIWLLTVCVLLVLGFFGKASIQFSRVTILAWMLATPVLLVGERVLLRYLLRQFRKSGLNTRSIAIAGGGSKAAALIEVINQSPWMGLRVQGVYDDEGASAQPEGSSADRSLEQLLRQVNARQIDSVYLTYSAQQEAKIRNLLEQLADSTVSVFIVPDVFVSDLFRARWTSVGDVPLVSVFDSSIHGASLFAKRLEDLLLGSLILLLISPLLCGIAAAVKLTSPGPVLFKQRRYGLNGQVIEVWKFRSMCVAEDGAVVPQATRSDPRVTRLGAFLRCTSLDELPQFFNVLQGQMSIVGPRPHAVAHNEEYRKLIHGYMLRHKVKPGITGWAQVNGWRGETDTVEKMEKRVQYDLEYINNWSLWFDLKIILMTVFGGMRGKNAY